MKAKLIFVFLLAAGLISAWSITATATNYQNQKQQTIATPPTPQPIVPTPILPYCESQDAVRYYRPIGCPPNKANLQGLPEIAFPTVNTQANVLVWQQAVDWTFIREQQDLYMFSDNDGWIVGGGGDIVRWNGSDTQYYNVPGITSSLNAIDMISQSDGWIVGDQGIILHWDGTVWQQVASPTSMALREIDMVSANDGWIVGGDYPNAVILRWNGTSWSAVTVPPGSGGILLDVDMLSSTDGWIVGALPGTILRWNGSTWQSVVSPTTGYLNAIDMVSTNDGWAVGNSGSWQNGIVIHWNGSVWQTVSLPSGVYELEEISMDSTNDGWATSWWGGHLLHWDGATWTKVGTPGGIHSIQMFSAEDGWAVGWSIYQYTTFNGLTVHVDNASGQPASGANVLVFTPEGSWVTNGYGSTDSSGNVYLNISPGTYHVIVYSLDEHFGLYQLNITSPSTVNLTASGTPAIALTAKKREGTPLDQAYIKVALSSGPPYYNLFLGKVNTNGQMTFNVTPGIYDINVYDTTNFYDLLKRQQNFSGASGTLNFDMSTNPTADIVISHPGESIGGVYLSHPGARVYGTWFSEVAEGTHIVLSANEDYSAYQEIRKDATNGDHWYYELNENRPDSTFQSGEVFTFTVGGALTVAGRTESAYVGDYINLADPRDSHDNSLTYIYTTTADYNGYNEIYPYIYLTDPNGVGTQLDWTWYYIPYTALTGWYDVHYDWETGPYQGLLVADSTFEVRPIATSAIIPTGGGVFTSTFDSTSYAFANGTFTDTVMVTHTVRFADIPSFGEMVGIGHTFDIIAVYSSTGQPAQPTQPYTITILYTDDEKGSVIEDTLALYYWDGNQWVKDTSSVVAVRNNTLTATPSHFSTWAVMGETRRVYLPLIRK